jgi:hypothetical protein
VRAQRRDLSEVGIIEALEQMGYQAQRMYVPAPFDLLVSRPPNPQCIPMECKTPGGKVTEAQADYFLMFPDLIVYTPDDAVRAAEKYL